MLDKSMEKSLNRQINQELDGAYNYLAMAAYMDRINLTGFATWLRAQREEELAHAMRLYQYVLDRGGRIELEALSKPQADFEGVREVFVKAIQLEKQNTSAINDLFRLAVEQGDYATQSHLQWFIDEQVEEEKQFDEVSGLLDMVGEDKSALLLLNDKLGARKDEEKK
ncbi:MAG: ferritin [Acidobacteriota bacterium]|nr:ferritin [Acidobacteriota bacterium]